jgi:hypothetical protein
MTPGTGQAACCWLLLRHRRAEANDGAAFRVGFHREFAPVALNHRAADREPTPILGRRRDERLKQPISDFGRDAGVSGRVARPFGFALTDPGRRAEARDRLAQVYGWFTVGLDIADLIDAKALPDELA